VNLSPQRKRRVLDRTESQIVKHLPQYIAKLEELACGVLVEKIDGRSGEATVYKAPPDRQALEFLIEHGIGKVPTKLEVTGEEGGGIAIIPWLPPSAKVKELPEGAEEKPPVGGETIVSRAEVVDAEAALK
jgi:hypothetical protein